MKVDYEKVANLYAQFRRVHPAVLENLLGDLKTSSRVLEVGCGSGNYISAISEMIGCECHGIEPSEAMLAGARKRDTAVLWKKGGAESLAYPPATFTFIFCVDVIHHVSNVPLFVSEIFRALSHRGRACIVTDSESDIRERKPLSLYFPNTVELDLARYPRNRILGATHARVGFFGGS